MPDFGPPLRSQLEAGPSKRARAPSQLEARPYKRARAPPSNWDIVCPFYRFPEDIRRVIYTTNPIESVNRQLRKVLKTKGALPSTDAAYKLLWMTLGNARRSWTVCLPNWHLALQQFAIHFDDRLSP